MSPTPHGPLAGRYRLVSPLGEGGMGRVWRARDELLGRDVAVKEITPAGLSRTELGDVRERAIREARAIAQINHQAVVRIFDVVVDQGAPWIIMELVRSRSLHDVVDQDGPLSPAETARIGLEILGALRAAHEAGILHRDVKPANVLLSADGRVVLTDFGLATLAGDSAMTHTGIVLGSPSYLAPERALDEPADAKSDLWSLGATLYAAVEGRPPYDKSTPMATLAALMVEPPPPPEHAGPLRPALAALLQKDPADRATTPEAERLLQEASGSGAAHPGVGTSGHPSGLSTAETVPSAAPGRVRRRWLVPVAAAVLLAGVGLAVAQPLLSDATETAPGDAAIAAPPPASPETTRTGGGEPADIPAAPVASAEKKVKKKEPTKRASPSVTPKAAKTEAPPVKAVGEPIRNHGTGTCLDLPKAGADIRLWECLGSDGQKFSRPGDGTLRVLGQCVQIKGTGNGARLRAAGCDGSAGQRFNLNAARDLVSLQVVRCVDVPDTNTANGVPAQIWECAGTDNQKWN